MGRPRTERSDESRTRPTRRWASVLAGSVTTAALLLGALVPVSAAVADSAPVDPSDPLAPTTVTADSLPAPQIDGVVWDQVVAGGTVYVGGQFTTARPAGAAAGVATVARSNFLAYDLATGELRSDISTSFDGQIRAMAVSPDQSRLYVAGSFTKVDGTTRYRVAAFDLPSMTLVSSFAPTVNATVESIAVSATSVYLGGIFTSVQKNERLRGAALSTTNAALQPWNPSVLGGSVKAIVVSPDASKIVLGGGFTSIGGSTEPGLGMGAVTGDSGVVLPWAANSIIRNGGTKSSVFSLSSDVDSVYGVGYQHSQGGKATEGTFRMSWADGSLQWLADCHGDSYSVQVVGDVVYTAGHAHACDNTGGFPNAEGYHRAVAFSKESVGRVAHNTPPGGWTYGNFEGNPATELLHWFPDMNAGSYTGLSQGPWDVTAGGEYVLYAGEFTTVNGAPQQGLARFGTRAVSTNAQGPQLGGSKLAPTVTAIGDGAAKVTWPSNEDRDSEVLRYDVIRDNDTASPVFTVNAAASFWDRPDITFIDQGLTVGRDYRYRVKTTDATGNVAWGDNVTFTAAGGAPIASTDLDRSVLADSPSHYWSLNEATGTTGGDWVGAAELQLSGTTLGRAQPGAESDGGGTSTSFGGDARGVTTTTEPFTNRFSLEAWVQTTSTSGGPIIGASSGTALGSGNRDRLVYLGDDGRVRFGLYPGTVRTVTSANAVNDGEWHHVVAVLGNTGQQLYIDGALEAEDRSTVRAQDYSGYWTVGGTSLSGWPDRPSSDHLNGRLDDVAVYPRALTGAQIAAHHSVGVDGIAPEPANQAPTAAFTPTVDGLDLTVDGTASTDADGTVTGYAWDFGDGATASGAAAGHAYTAAGDYPVTLTVTDDDQATASVTQVVTVTAPVVDPEPGAQPFASDAFERSVANAWGDAETGGSWTVAGGKTAFAVSGSTATIQAPAGGTRAARLIGVTEASADVLTDVTPSVVANGGGGYYSVITRQVGTVAYTARLWFRAANDVRLQLLSGTTVLVSQKIDGLSASAGGTLRLRAAAGAPVDGATSLTAKVWAGSAAEPADWQVSATDAAAALQAPGAVGLSGYLSASASNGPVTFTVDTFDAVTAGGREAAAPAPDPTDPTPPAEPTDPTPPAEPTDPTTPTDPTAPADPASLVTDDFAREVTGGWGDALLGGAWTLAGGRTGFAVTSNRGTITAAPGATRTAVLAATPVGAAETSVTFSLDQAPSGGGQFVSLIARQVGSERYVTRAWIQASGVVQLQVQRNGNTISALNLAGTSVGAGSEVHLVTRTTGVSGTTIEAKAWTGDVEPTTFQLSVADDTPGLQGVGAVGLALYLSGSATATTTVSFRDFRVLPLE
ncbi:LamG-like jellyroll fold domain-containing protein [Plantibacter sp. VKM Ac-2876]|uniref:LamG-like jellyroll fold domain-containing protein n=1 Tax=Plantibacter sp. VKM Ac-2876 TaxID=2783826 RepID=UPI00188CDD56|nr:PKD domain-containing protein [Plantibacter sp. VKM Ac-2876]